MSQNNNTENLKLEELAKGDESVYFVKDFTVEPEIEGKKIVCDLFIKTLDMPKLTDWNEDKKPFLSELYLVPRPEFITKENIQSVSEFGGFNLEFIKDDARFFAIDVISYGLGIRLAGGMDSFSTEQESIDAMKKEAQGCNLIGFYLDKTWNQIGTTGWDTLLQLVGNVDALKETINRMEAKQ